MLTILTWFWQQPGRSLYSPEHVNIWAGMVRRHMSGDYRLACVTDIPQGIDKSIEIIEPPGEFVDWRIPSWGGNRPQCLRRIAMFAPDAAKTFGERFVCMDIDCVISGDLAPLFETSAAFKITNGTARGRPYNGSMMLLTAGARPQVYQRFTLAGAIEAGKHFVGSDQAWISHCLGPNEATWTQADGVQFYLDARRNPMRARVTFYPGAAKPWTSNDPHAARHYRGQRSGRCLILGYGPTVWEDAEAAMREGPVAGIIASPEAAEHWPGEIIATALSDRDCEDMARCSGFDDIVFCGRSAATELAA